MKNDIIFDKECKPKDFHRFVSEEYMKQPPPYAKNRTDSMGYPGYGESNAKPKNNDLETFQKEVESQLNPSVLRRQQKYKEIDRELHMQLEKNLIRERKNWKPRDHSKNYLTGLRKYAGPDTKDNKTYPKTYSQIQISGSGSKFDNKFSHITPAKNSEITTNDINKNGKNSMNSLT